MKRKSKTLRKRYLSPSAPDSNSPPPWHTWIIVGAITALAMVPFLNSFQGQFLFDDEESIVSNDHIRHLWPVWDPSLKWPSGTRPVTELSLAINYAISGLELWSYHAANLAIHILAGGVLFGIVRRTLVQQRAFVADSRAALYLAMAVSLTWMVHPLQTESVTYIIQRHESLMGLFYLLTLYFSLRGFSSSRQGYWYGAAILACALGMATKQSMVTAPITVLVYDSIFQRRSFREALRERWFLYGGLALTWIILGSLLWISRKFMISAGLGMVNVNPWNYLLTQSVVIVRYLRLSIWPDSLCLDYDWPVMTDVSMIIPYAVFLWVLLGATAWACKRRLGWGFLGAWFFLTLATTSSVIPIADVIAERRMYLPLAAVVALILISAYLLVDLMVHRLIPRRKQVAVLVQISLLALILSSLSYSTIRRNELYHDPLSMWRDVVQKRPDNPRAHLALGSELLKRGSMTEAVNHFAEAVRIKPDYAAAQFGLGMALDRIGKHHDAMTHITEALRLKPNYAEAHNSLGALLSRDNRNQEALAHYEEALRIKPGLADAQSNLGGLLYLLNRWQEAEVHLSESLRLNPNNAEAHNNLGLALFRLGRVEEAVTQLSESVKLDSENPGTHFSLGRALFLQQKYQDASKQYEEALRIKPDYAEAHYHLGIALENQHKFVEAVSHYRQVLRLKPEWPEPVRRLAWMFATSNDPSLQDPLAAVQYAEKASQLADRHDPVMMDTLGVAYASAGRFGQASKVTQKAVELAVSSGNESLASMIQNRLSLYRAGRPFRENPTVK